jgi:hypothetical protein
MNTGFCSHIIIIYFIIGEICNGYTFPDDYKEKPCCLVVQNILYEFSQRVIDLGNWKREHSQCLKDMHVQFSNLPIKYVFQFLQAFTICVL